MTVDSFKVENCAGEKKPPGVSPAVSGDSLALYFACALASPAAERCENQKYAKK
jgi:hypothetical protein